MAAREVEITISVGVDRETFRKTAETEPIKAAEALDPELRAFEQWMMRRSMEPLTRVEMQIIREYLGFKLVT